LPRDDTLYSHSKAKRSNGKIQGGSAMQVLVIGAGVIGLAVARTAALAGHDVTVAEMTGGIANGVSSRNSEVVHGGLYYPTNSLRARHCVRGRRMLYEFCASHGVPHRKCGKLIVATNETELAKVETILKQGETNCVEGLEMIGGNAARALEGELACIGALISPESGIVDSHGYMNALWGELEDHGGMIAFETPVERMSYKAPHWRVQFGGSEPATIEFDAVINSGGLGAQALARRIDGYPADKVPKLVLAKGNYFSFAGRPVFSRLVYPTPVDGGLGVHVTLDLAGRMRFGPDVEWISEENYTVDPRRADSFYDRIRTYWPGLPANSLVPDYCGIRPKLTGPGEPAADFLIAGPSAHGMPRLINLFGIESPGLTSSLSIADDVTKLLN
jgi:L-2-hydroxyglutarate oxidase LhgO